MVYVSLKKIRLFLIIVSILCSISVNAQNKVSVFSDDYKIYLDELNVLMSSSDNSTLKDSYKQFKRISSTNSFTKNQEQIIISISNKMLDKRLRAAPHFNQFILSLSSFKKDPINNEKLDNWLSIASKVVEDVSTKKLLMFFYFTIDLLDNNTLRETKTTTWKTSSSEYLFEIDDNGPYIVFSKSSDFICLSNGSRLSIFDTEGNYFPFINRWVGYGGSMNWTQKGISSDSVYVNLKKYNIDTRTTSVKADSVSFFNKYMFEQPMLGVFSDKITKGKQGDNYPKFVSYAKDLVIKDIYPNVDYKGGYKLQGNDFIADGGKYAEAKIIFNNNGKVLFVANANKFILGGNKIISKQVGIKIYFDNDSLYHSNLKFSYDNLSRKLKLSKSGRSRAPMLNTYHKLNMEFELLEWKIDENIITFGSLPGTSQSQINFESVDMYLESRFDELQGIDAIHPLILIEKYVNEKEEDQFFVEDFAHFAKFPLVQIQHYLMDLANKGFIFYDFGEERITVLPSLSRYVLAKSQQGDYDVIQFNSKVNGNSLVIVNAVLNIASKDLIIRGINQIAVSDSQKVTFYPSGGEVKILKNRDFMFNGRIFAGNGRVNLYGRDFHFKYDDFKVDLQQIDSVQLSVPLKPLRFDLYNNPLLTRVKTVIEAVTGELIIDHPSNKSGLRKDSFPQFPIFKSFNDSYVYYDNSTIFDGVYKRDEFSFHLEPFEIDSLESYNGNGLWFSGTFKSLDIFPTFNDTLRLQYDYSLGFTRKTPLDGFPLYKGKARYYDDITLGNNGLRGSGKFEYLSSTVHSDDIVFYPDSTSLLSNALTIDEVSKGIEFPQASNTKAYCHYRPYLDKLNIYQIEDMFSLYSGKSSLEGSILLQPIGLTGNGVMKLDLAEISSEFFSFNSNWFKSDTANLNVFDNTKALAFSAQNLRANIDVSDREGIFYSNGVGSYVNFPASEYICFIDKLRWEMDKEQLTLGEEIGSQSSGSRFVSLNSNQDSLSFVAKNADYNLKDYIINAYGVDSINIADAIIYPDSGVLIVERNANIRTLSNANITVDALTRYHAFSSSTVNINGANNYSGSGDYVYVDALNNKQDIYFSDIKVNDDTITIATGLVDDVKTFKIGERYDFKGEVQLLGDRKNLTFNGFFKINHNCLALSKEWIKFSSEINSSKISFNINDNLYNDNDDKLYSGIYISRDSSFYYSTFLSSKKRGVDFEIFSASSTVYYNNKNSSFIIGGIDSTSNYLILDEKTCSTYGSGDIDLNLNLGRIETKVVGNISNTGKNNLTFDGFLMLDFDFSKEAMEIMAQDIFSAPGDEIFEYNKNYENNLSRIVGYDIKDELMIDLEMHDAFEKLPNSMNYSLSFTDIILSWDNKNKSFISENNIGLGSINNTQINGILEGYVLIEKGRNSDILTIYLQTEFYDEYYFVYKNGLMRAISTNPEFNLAISDLKDTKRKSKSIKGKAPYRYMLANEDAPEKFLKRIKKQF